MKSLWERHIGHVLLVFLSSFSDLGFVGAEARQLRTHSGEGGKSDMICLVGCSKQGIRTKTECVVAVHEEAVILWCLETDCASLGGCCAGGWDYLLRQNR